MLKINVCLKWLIPGALLLCQLLVFPPPIAPRGASGGHQQVPPAAAAGGARQDLKVELGTFIVRPGSGAWLAVADFIDASPRLSNQSTELTNTVRADLDFAKVTSIVSRSLYPPAEIKDLFNIDFAPWGKDPVRADYLVAGRLMSASDQLNLEVYLYDVQAGQRLFAKTYRETADQLRRLAHEIADDIVYQLTGRAGIAASNLAYVSSRSGHREIYIMDYDGHADRRYTFDRSLALFPSWSADGKLIAYTSYAEGKSHIYIRSVETNRLVRALRFDRGTTSSPVFSPDGKYLSFCSSKDSNSMQLYLSDLQTGRLRRLTHLRSVVNTSPRWNPRTSLQIAFISNRSGSPQIYTIDISGSNLTRLLTRGGAADSPSWSPNGQYIAFSWRPPTASSYNIFVMDIASREIVQLTRGPGSNESPVWSPDGRHLAFQSNRTGRFEIYVMHVDGTEVKRLTTNGGTSPSWWHEPNS